MKKCLLMIFLIMIFYMFLSNSLAKNLKIPEDAIRIRIIPNSNSKFDQDIKMGVKDKIEIRMYDLLKGAKDSEEAREIIKNNLNLVSEDVVDVLHKNNYDINYDVKFGYNYFPQKEYKGIKYNEGYYESLLVTLGKGEGDNWWCVLFPPLCLIEGNEGNDVNYKSIVQEFLKKYIH